MTALPGELWRAGQDGSVSQGPDRAEHGLPGGLQSYIQRKLSAAVEQAKQKILQAEVSLRWTW